MIFLASTFIPNRYWPDTDPPPRLTTQNFRQIIHLLLRWEDRVVCLLIGERRQDKHLSISIDILWRRAILLRLQAELHSQRINSNCPADMLEASQKVIIVIRRVEAILRILYVLSEVDEPLLADPEPVELCVAVSGWVRKF